MKTRGDGSLAKAGTSEQDAAARAVRVETPSLKIIEDPQARAFNTVLETKTRIVAELETAEPLLERSLAALS